MNVEMKLIFKCDDCGFSWRSDDVTFTEDEQAGANCPKCESENIGGTEIKN